MKPNPKAIQRIGSADTPAAADPQTHRQSARQLRRSLISDVDMADMAMDLSTGKRSIRRVFASRFALVLGGAEVRRRAQSGVS